MGVPKPLMRRTLEYPVFLLLGLTYSGVVSDDEGRIDAVRFKTIMLRYQLAVWCGAHFQE